MMRFIISILIFNMLYYCVNSEGPNIPPNNVDNRFWTEDDLEDAVYACTVPADENNTRFKCFGYNSRTFPSVSRYVEGLTHCVVEEQRVVEIEGVMQHETIYRCATAPL